MENLIEDNTNRNKKGEDDGEEKKKRPVIKSATDLQRLKLEKLMKNPEKQIIIPEPPKEKDYMQTVPSFVRNVMGSSAGAGSGEFHVYRHLRRKEYARQKCIHARSMREQLDEEYKSKLEKNRLDAEAKTAKKRAKRLKKKQRAKKPKIKQDNEVKHETTEEEDDDEEEKGEAERSAQKNDHGETENKTESEDSVTVDDSGKVDKDVMGPAINVRKNSGAQKEDPDETKNKTELENPVTVDNGDEVGKEIVGPSISESGASLKNVEADDKAQAQQESEAIPQDQKEVENENNVGAEHFKSKVNGGNNVEDIATSQTKQENKPETSSDVNETKSG